MPSDALNKAGFTQEQEAGSRRSIHGERRLRRRLLGAANATLCASLIFSAPLFASADPLAVRGGMTQQGQADRQAQFDIPAQPLSRALTAFGRQSGLQIAVDTAVVANLETVGVSGTLTLETALRQLLVDTGLTYQFTSANAVTLEKVTAREDVTVLNPIRVEGSAETATSPVRGYRARRSATGTKTDTPISETPVSVQVIPRDLIDDQAALNLKDVYENVSSVYQAGNTLNAQTEVLPIIRGFESPLLYRNGLRSTLAGAVDLVNVERVEVLKGPASILYGALEPGGIVNYVTKRPLASSQYVVEQEVGSFNLLRSTADLTGPTTEGGSLLYRVNFAYTNTETFRDVIEIERVALAPSFLWQPKPETELLVDLSFLQETQPYDTGVPIGFNNEKLVSNDTFFGDPDLKGRNIHDYAASYQFSHRFNPIFSLNHQFQIHRAEAKNEAIRPRNVIGTVGAEVIRLRFQNEDRVDDEAQMVADLKAEFPTGTVDHNFLVGTELSYEDSDFRRFRQNIANVAISNNPNVSFTPPGNQPQQVRLSSNRRASVYIQDQFSLLDDGRLKLLVGGRFDAVKTKSETDGVDSPNVEDSDFTGRVGALYKLVEGFSVYANYAESFNPQLAGTLDAGGTPLVPETGTQYEAGVKAEFLNGLLAATASVYQIQKQNVAVLDNDLLNATGQVAFLPEVEQQSRGVELDLTGRLTQNLSLTAYYSYTDSEVLGNPQDATNVGNRLGNVPLQKARLWMKYTLPSTTPLSGLSISGGVRYVSENTSQFDTNVKLDAYAVLDLAAQYDYKAARFRLNVNNVLDEDYFVRASNQAIVHPGEPLTVRGSVSVKF